MKNRILINQKVYRDYFYQRYEEVRSQIRQRSLLREDAQKDISDTSRDQYNLLWPSKSGCRWLRWHVRPGVLTRTASSFASPQRVE